MRQPSISIGRLKRLGFVVGVVLVLLSVAGRFGRASALGTAASSSPGMTIYSVANPNSSPLNVEHCFSDSAGFEYSFWSQIPAKSNATYHVSTMSQIPSPFNGTVTLYADAPFTAQIVGYDNVTPTATSTATPIPTPSPTITPTPRPTPRVGNGPGPYQVWIPYVRGGK